MMKLTNNKPKPLAEKTIVICGASSGIGKATALEFARKGCSLVLAARRNDLLEELAEECINHGAKQARAVKANVTDVESLSVVADTALELTGFVDVWINNAGLGAVGEYNDIPMEVHEQVVKTNLLGHMNGTYVVLPIFKKQQFGTIINTISVGGWAPEPYAVAYTASKFGLRGFSESIRCELRHFKNIHVCDVFPAYIDTPGFQHAANYVGKKLKPIPPVFPAKRVAKAMVRLAKCPKGSVYVGETAMVFKYINFLTPELARRSMSRLMENYFKRAKPAPVSDGAVFDSVITGTGISGGWLKPKKQKSAIMATVAVAGIAAIGGFLLTNRKSG